MRVVTTAEASAFIESHGGVVYVRPLKRRCCGGAMTVLSATTEPPADVRLYEPVGDPSLGVRYRRDHDSGWLVNRALPDRANAVARWGSDRLEALGRIDDEPHELLVELRGNRRPRLTACWDGCVYKL